MPEISEAKEGHQVKISKETHEQLIEMHNATSLGYKKLIGLAVDRYFSSDDGFEQLKDAFS